MILDFVGPEKELEREEAFRMAFGGEANWKVAGDEGLQKTLLEVIQHWLEAQDLKGRMTSVKLQRVNRYG